MTPEQFDIFIDVVKRCSLGICLAVVVAPALAAWIERILEANND